MQHIYFLLMKDYDSFSEIMSETSKSVCLSVSRMCETEIEGEMKRVKRDFKARGDEKQFEREREKEEMDLCMTREEDMRKC